MILLRLVLVVRQDVHDALVLLVVRYLHGHSIQLSIWDLRDLPVVDVLVKDVLILNYVEGVVVEEDSDDLRVVAVVMQPEEGGDLVAELEAPDPLFVQDVID